MNNRSMGERLAAIEGQISVISQVVVQTHTLAARAVAILERPNGSGGAQNRDLAALTRAVNRLTTQGEHVAGELDRLREEVAENNTVIGSATVLLQELKRKLDEAIASGNMAEVQALAESLDAQTQALAAAVAANTPATP